MITFLISKLPLVQVISKITTQLLIDELEGSVRENVWGNSKKRKKSCFLDCEKT